MPDPDFHHNIEVEESAQSQLSEPKRGLGKVALIGLFAMITLPLLALPFWLDQPQPPDNLNTGADEELLPSPAHLKLDVPPPLQETPADAGPLPRATDADNDALAEAERARRRAEADAEEARRAAEAERLARESDNDERKWERYRSPVVVTETGQSADLTAGEMKPPAEGEKSAGTFQETNPNNQFLAALAAKPVEVAKAEKNKRIDALVPQGTMIRGVLETAVQTDLPGTVRAVTTEDVWSFDGRRILIPAASRMIGEYNAGIAQGQTRAFIVWNRLLRADGVSLNLGSIGTDELGRSGSGGDVNNHYFKRFGSAFLLSVLATGAQVLAAPDTNRINTGPITTTITDPTTGKSTSTTSYPDNNVGSDLASKGATIIAQSFAQLAQEALKSTVNIQPTITISQGTAVAIFVRRDLDFSDLYPDPVMEKLKELKKGRGWNGQ